MPNKTFYINPDNDKSLKHETNKSGLVNDLLKQYYSKPNCKCPEFPLPHSHLETDEVSSPIRPVHNIKQNEDGTISPIDPSKPSFVSSPAVGYDEVGFISPEDLKKVKIGKEVTVESTPKGKKNISVGFANSDKLQKFAEEKKLKFCPNGHAIPDGRSKCMGKGCKYA